jgi:Leucine-rich repeat (LRR) protein
MIVSVRLASNKLAQLPVGMKEFKKLKELVASDNVLTKIQPEVLALRTLKYVSTLIGEPFGKSRLLD